MLLFSLVRTGWLAASFIVAGPALAKTEIFTAVLSGIAAPTITGSKASGTARIAVDLDRQLVSIELAVEGIPLAGLWDQLVAAPVGPIHLHQYGSADHSGHDVTLVMPVPFGASYLPTPQGFTVSVKDYAFATGAALVQTSTGFAGFVTALETGTVVLNIHTDAHNDGEISGTVVKGS
jgi:CHRD domain